MIVLFMSMESRMETIRIGNRTWQKYQGDEGQDVYVAEFVENENDVIGTFVDESSYDILIDSDADFYLPTKSLDGGLDFSEENIAFKFRKNVFTLEEQQGAFDGLYDAAVESNNRGMAAGSQREGQSGNRDWVTTYQSNVLSWYERGQPKAIDGSIPLEEFASDPDRDVPIGKNVWLRNSIESDFGTYKNFFPIAEERLSAMSLEESQAEAKRIRKTMISDTSYANALWSGIAGFYGRYPRIPYGRQTAYTEHNREQFEKCYPFARKLEKVFRELLPKRHAAQQACADSTDKRFLIGEDTTFTTITVNTTTKDRNARMACHRDAGSLNEGYSNLTVISDGKKDWKGGYLVTPEVRAAINVRPGDLLLIDNMRIIHGNTPIGAPESGEDDLLRMSLIFYYREDMLKLGSWEYEHARRAYVDSRRKNEDHPLWRPYWNGVSPGMWSEKEWYNYLTNVMGEGTVMEYHPEAFESQSSLESFFG